MVAALLVFGIAGVGFGGQPWLAFAGGALLMVASCLPERIEALRRSQGEPVTDIVIAMFLEMSWNVAVAFLSAWAGYGLRLLLMFFLRNQ